MRVQYQIGMCEQALLAPVWMGDSCPHRDLPGAQHVAERCQDARVEAVPATRGGERERLDQVLLAEFGDLREPSRPQGILGARRCAPSYVRPTCRPRP